MKYSKTDLKTCAESIVKTQNLDIHTDTETALLAAVNEAIDAYKGAVERKVSEKELNGYINAVKAELAYYDDYQRHGRLDKLAKMDADAAIAAYLADQTAETLGFVQSGTGYVLASQVKEKPVTVAISPDVSGLPLARGGFSGFPAPGGGGLGSPGISPWRAMPPLAAMVPPLMNSS